MHRRWPSLWPEHTDGFAVSYRQNTPRHSPEAKSISDSTQQLPHSGGKIVQSYVASEHEGKHTVPKQDRGSEAEKPQSCTDMGTVSNSSFLSSMTPT